MASDEIIELSSSSDDSTNVMEVPPATTELTSVSVSGTEGSEGGDESGQEHSSTKKATNLTGLDQLFKACQALSVCGQAGLDHTYAKESVDSSRPRKRKYPLDRYQEMATPSQATEVTSNVWPPNISVEAKDLSTSRARKQKSTSWDEAKPGTSRCSAADVASLGQESADKTITKGSRHGSSSDDSTNVMEVPPATTELTSVSVSGTEGSEGGDESGQEHSSTKKATNLTGLDQLFKACQALSVCGQAGLDHTYAKESVDSSRPRKRKYPLDRYQEMATPSQATEVTSNVWPPNISVEAKDLSTSRARKQKSTSWDEAKPGTSRCSAADVASLGQESADKTITKGSRHGSSSDDSTNVMEVPPDTTELTSVSVSGPSRAQRWDHSYAKESVDSSRPRKRKRKYPSEWSQEVASPSQATEVTSNVWAPSISAEAKDQSTSRARKRKDISWDEAKPGTSRCSAAGVASLGQESADKTITKSSRHGSSSDDSTNVMEVPPATTELTSVSVSGTEGSEGGDESGQEHSSTKKATNLTGLDQLFKACQALSVCGQAGLDHTYAKESVDSSRPRKRKYPLDRYQEMATPSQATEVTSNVWPPNISVEAKDLSTSRARKQKSTSWDEAKPGTSRCSAAGVASLGQESADKTITKSSRHGSSSDDSTNVMEVPPDTTELTSVSVSGPSRAQRWDHSYAKESVDSSRPRKRKYPSEWSQEVASPSQATEVTSNVWAPSISAEAKDQSTSRARKRKDISWDEAKPGTSRCSAAGVASLGQESADKTITKSSRHGSSSDDSTNVMEVPPATTELTSVSVSGTEGSEGGDVSGQEHSSTKKATNLNGLEQLFKACQALSDCGPPLSVGPVTDRVNATRTQASTSSWGQAGLDHSYAKESVDSSRPRKSKYPWEWYQKMATPTQATGVTSNVWAPSMSAEAKDLSTSRARKRKSTSWDEAKPGTSRCSAVGVPSLGQESEDKTITKSSRHERQPGRHQLCGDVSIASKLACYKPHTHRSILDSRFSPYAPHTQGNTEGTGTGPQRRSRFDPPHPLLFPTSEFELVQNQTILQILDEPLTHRTSESLLRVRGCQPGEATPLNLSNIFIPTSQASPASFRQAEPRSVRQAAPRTVRSTPRTHTVTSMTSTAAYVPSILADFISPEESNRIQSSSARVEPYMNFSEYMSFMNQSSTSTQRPRSPTASLPEHLEYQMWPMDVTSQNQIEEVDTSEVDSWFSNVFTGDVNVQSSSVPLVRPPPTIVITPTTTTSPRPPSPPENIEWTKRDRGGI